MSEKLPRVTAKEIAAVVEKLGFTVVRQSGSHRIYKNSAGKRITIPMHSGKVLHPKVLKSILVDADLDASRLRQLL
jgi:predicted RNA binding protein YcfA (HicA-like mRNA interferase family)